MTQAVQTPLPLYLGLDGQRLQAGYLFFGVVELNPETNPVQMFWDAALTQPAAQPIRTINGMPDRNGTPSMLYTNVDHSLTIRDSAGRLVLYIRNSADYSVAAAIAAAQDTADAAVAAAATAQGTANAAVTTANAAVTTANAAVTTANAANSKIRVWPKNTSIAFLGDSIMRDGLNNTADETRNANRGFTFWVPFLTSQRYSSPQALNFGISGQTSTQIAARVSDVVASGAGVCVVCAGTNDITGGLTTAQTQSNLAAIYDALAAAQILVIALPILPRTLLTEPQYSFPQKINDWIQQQGAVRPGFRYIYPFTFSDPYSLSFSPRPDWTYDGLHPKAIGAFAIATPIAEYLNTLIPYSAPEIRSVTDYWNPSNLRGPVNPNPMVAGVLGTLGAGITGAVADAYRVQAFANGGNISSLAVTCSKSIALRTEIENQRIVVGGTATGGFDTCVIFDLLSSVPNVVAGDTIELMADIEIPGATIGVSGVEAYLAAEMNGVFKWVKDGYPIVADDFLFKPLPEGRFRTPPLLLSGTIGPRFAGIKISFRNTASAARSIDLRINNFAVRKVVP
jgi:lysophospholipase L1-like esterase